MLRNIIRLSIIGVKICISNNDCFILRTRNNICIAIKCNRINKVRMSFISIDYLLIFYTSKLYSIVIGATCKFCSILTECNRIYSISMSFKLLYFFISLYISKFYCAIIGSACKCFSITAKFNRIYTLIMSKTHNAIDIFQIFNISKLYFAIL